VASHRRRLGVLAAIALPLMVVGCGSSSGGSSGGSVALEGTNWVLTSGASLGVPLAGVTASLELTSGSASGTSGCNRYHAPYQLSGSKLTIGPQIATTQMACGPAQTAVEQVYLERLPKVATYSIKGSTLTLFDQSGTALLEFTASTGGTGLAGSWIVTSYYTGSAVQSVTGGVEITADFTTAAVSGNTGCNTYGGPMAINGSTIRIGPLTSTLIACPTEELGTQEHQYLAALDLATTFKVTGNRLDLFRPGGTYAVTYQRA
jgi:heat shock protein HslJ